MISSSQIVATARNYVGTPFRHQGRRRGVAVDCVGLILCVAEDLGLRDGHGRAFLRSDYLNYGSQPVDAFVHDECQRRMIVVALVDESGRYTNPLNPSVPANIPAAKFLRPGDILTMRVPSVPCHTAIVTDLQSGLGIVHAYSGALKCVEHRLDDKWIKRIAGVFRLD